MVQTVAQNLAKNAVIALSPNTSPTTSHPAASTWQTMANSPCYTHQTAHGSRRASTPRTPQSTVPAKFNPSFNLKATKLDPGVGHPAYSLHDAVLGKASKASFGLQADACCQHLLVAKVLIRMGGGEKSGQNPGKGVPIITTPRVSL